MLRETRFTSRHARHTRDDSLSSCVPEVGALPPPLVRMGECALVGYSEDARVVPLRAPLLACRPGGASPVWAPHYRSLMRPAPPSFARCSHKKTHPPYAAGAGRFMRSHRCMQLKPKCFAFDRGDPCYHAVVAPCIRTPKDAYFVVLVQSARLHDSASARVSSGCSTKGSHPRALRLAVLVLKPGSQAT